MKRLTLFLLLSLLWIPVRADGLLLSTEDDYPGHLLRNRLTSVDVRIDGVIAETTAYFEFENEWHRETDAVFSFPLPVGARSVRLLYEFEGVVYEAVLRVKEQATNPGTGEGGIVAEINEYLGTNGIRMALQDIAPGSIQRIEITYLETLESTHRTVSYRYPLDTSRFVDHALDLVEFNVDIRSGLTIEDVQVSSHQGAEVVRADAGAFELVYRKSKEFVAADFELTYSVTPDAQSLDFYTWWTEAEAGYLAAVVRPDSVAGQTLPRSLVFAIHTSSRLAAGLAPAVSAVRAAIAALGPEDRFNIVAFNSLVNVYRSSLVNATETEIASAQQFLEGLQVKSGTQMQDALQEALSSIGDESGAPAIIVFTDGRAAIDPQALAAFNTQKVGIFPVGVGNVDRARLDMLAGLNRGFVTYLEEEDDLREAMQRVIRQIENAVLDAPQVSFTGTDVFDVTPQALPNLFATRPLIVAARYTAPASGAIEWTGRGVSGEVAVQMPVEFGQSAEFSFARLLWAKRTIDRMEQQIAIYGPTEALRDSVIALSLQYNIRSRYTAYVADYETQATTDVQEDLPVERTGTRIEGNFPNPFSDHTRIRVYVAPSDAGKAILLRIYDVQGRLVAVIDMTGLSAGWNEIPITGSALERVAAGTLFVRLVVGGVLRGTHVMHRTR